MGLFRKSKSLKGTSKDPKQVQIYPFDYHPKIILAWNECLNGNEKIANWLLENGFQELVIMSSIIHYEDSGRNWLLNNGFPHLLAFINTMEGNDEAARWLEVNKFDELKKLAEAAGDNDKSWQWVQDNCEEDLILVCRTIRKIRSQNGD